MTWPKLTNSSRILFYETSAFRMNCSDARPRELNLPSEHDWQQKHENLQDKNAAEKILWPNTSKHLAVSVSHFNELFNHTVVCDLAKTVKELLSERAALESSIMHPKTVFQSKSKKVSGKQSVGSLKTILTK